MIKKDGVLLRVDFEDVELLDKNPKKFWKDVTEIGYKAFNPCYFLKSIDIPEGVTKIANYAFCNCSRLTDVNIPSTVTEIGNGAFFCCHSLNKIDIPDSVTSIGEDAFSQCEKLESVKLSKNLTVIGESTFNWCYKLSDMVIPEGVTRIGKRAFAECVALKSLVIPSTVLKIGEFAFLNCQSLKELEIPYGVQQIDYAAFADCERLKTVKIPSSVMTVKDSVFYGCKSLETVCLAADASDEIKQYFKKDFTLHKTKDSCNVPEVVELEEYYSNEDTLFKDVVNVRLKENKEKALDDYFNTVKKHQFKIATLSSKILKKQMDSTANLFSYEILSKHDAESFCVECMESCASNLYSGGEIRTMVLNPDMQQLVVRDAENLPVALGVIYVNRKNGYAVVNRFEVDEKYQGKDSERKQIYEKAMQCVADFALQYNTENPHNQIGVVTSGSSPNWTAINDFIEQNPQGKLLDAPSFDDYRLDEELLEVDCHKKQHIIWEKGKENERTA